jgi:hypothetical protein
MSMEGKLPRSESSIEDRGRRTFLKKGVLAVAAGAALAFFSRMPKAEALGAIHETKVSSSASGASYTVDLTQGTVFDVTMSAACTFTFSNPPPSTKVGSFTLILRQDGTGSRLATWPAAVDWPGASAPTLSTTASAVDILTFITPDAGTTWFGFFSGGGMG